MPTLRQKDGLSGFTKLSESEYDCFGAGHSSTSISAGLGTILFHLNKISEFLCGSRLMRASTGGHCFVLGKHVFHFLLKNMINVVVKWLCAFN